MDSDCQPTNGNGKRRRLTTKSFEGEDPIKLMSTMCSSNNVKQYLLHDFFQFKVAKGTSGDGNETGSHSKTAIVFDNGKGKVERLTYRELDEGADVVKKVVHKLVSKSIFDNNHEQQFIGVRCEMGILYPVLILGILRSGNAFYNIDQSNLNASVEDGTRDLGMKYILSDKTLTDSLLSYIVKEDVFIIDSERKNYDFVLFKIIQFMGKVDKPKIPNERFAYAIQTSGTTGQKKTVLVPHNCICDNIKDFAEVHWKLTKDDVIFGSAPPTFDPHVVELFSALAAGATILYTEPEVKLNGNLFWKILGYHKVTVLQITPNMFRRLCAFTSYDYLSALNLHLRIVAFGGDKCLEKEELREAVLKLPSTSNIQFQNIYGVTEVSCWASILNIDLDSPEPITLGKGLTNTELTLECEPEGEILIESLTRFCVIIKSSINTTLEIVSSSRPPYQYRTGDMGLMTPHGIIFLGRDDRVVKRHGMKVCLNEIEMACMSTGLVSYVECKMQEAKMYLVVKLKSEYESWNQSEVSLLPSALSTRMELPLFMYPDFIFTLRQQMPLNKNGKIDFDSIMKTFTAYKSMNKEPVSFTVTKNQIIQTLSPVWRSCTHLCTPNDILQENFINSGGTSISATRFVESAFMCLKLFGSEVHRKWEQSLLRQLFDEEGGTFAEITETIWKIISETPSAMSTNLINLDEDLLPVTQEMLPQNVMVPTEVFSNFEFQLMNDSRDDEGNKQIFHPSEEGPERDSNPKILSPPQPGALFHFPLGLCVDASPALVPSKGQAIIGCHGGILLCIDFNVLRIHSKSPFRAIAWKRKFPNRIEADVVIHPDSLFCYVGCHDCNFYKFSVSTGEVLCWTRCTNPIRSKCAVSVDNVVFVDCANSIFCVDSHALNILWSVNTFKLLATTSPVIFRRQTIVTTLSHGIISLEINSGNLLWTTVANHSPDLIYSSPKLVYKVGRRRSTFLVCSSNLGIETRDPKSGKLIWKNKSSASSLRIHPPLHNKCCDNLIWIENIQSNSSFLKMLEVETGQVLQTIQISHCGPITPNLLYTSNQNDQKCHLVYKTSTKNDENNIFPLLKFITLHEHISISGNAITRCSTSMKLHKSHKEGISQEPPVLKLPTADANYWGLGVPDFETFSKPKVLSDFVLFGGRDNQLHVIRLQSCVNF